MADEPVQRKNSTASVTSRASRNSKGFFRFRSSNSRRSSSSDMSLQVGDRCETTSIVTVRADEALESDVTGELPMGIAIEIIEIGELPRRAKVQAGSVQGWISVKTRLNEALVKKIENLASAFSDFEVGCQHEVISLVTLRSGECLDSGVLSELKPGTIVRIKELGQINKRRALVQVNSIEGWISLTTRQGEPLVGKVNNGGRSANEGGLFGTSASKIKVMLESARCGDLAAMQKIVEGNSGFMGKLSGRPNLNCTDIRGKTALIYASAFGNTNIVDYLLTKRHEVDVNVMDDTQKSALHHASKRARKIPKEMGDPRQAGIIKALINAGAIVEARDHNGCTALMFAVANGDEAVTRVLLEAGACVNVKDYESHTPLDYAKNFGYYELATLLKEHGAVDEDSEDGGDEEGFAIGESCAETCVAVQSQPANETVSSTSGARASKAPKKKAAGKKKSSADSESKPKAKAKSKAKGKVVKGKAKGKAAAGESGRKPIMAMATMVAELEADKDETAGGNKVEVLDLKEDADDKEINTDKLRAIIASSKVAGEIEGAIAVAKANGVDQSEIDKAEAVVKTLKQGAKALDRLRQAIEYPDVATLEEVIREATEQGCPKADIDNARKALEEEKPKQAARDELKLAQSSGDAKKLKDAIAKAEKAKLGKEEIETFQELLKGAESKDKAMAALQEAIATKDVAQLKFSIQQAKDAGLDAQEISKAQTILQEEEPKAEARATIAAALEKSPIDIPLIKAAIQVGKDAKLDPSEYKDCEDTVRREEERAKALQDLKHVFESVKDGNVDMTSIDAIGAAKKKLSDAINTAKENGVAEADLNDFELRRRKLHNAIEDLKGSIRVFCRVRPLSSKEKGQGDTEVTKRIDGMTLALTDKQDLKFAFDAVFLPGSQEEVFEDCRDLVQSAADGYNVTLFAYGQTGAGKTYTMGGTPDNPGVSRRTINEIFRVIEAQSGRYEYTVMGSMLELYRQDLVDLIAVAKDGRANAKKLQVRNDKAGNVQVEGLTEVECGTPDILNDTLERGIAARKVMATNMNSESSRSHLIFSIKIVSVNRETHEKLFGKILIVDLAGSERLSKSQVTGDGAKEAIEINKSLTALGDVIEALTKGAKQIPYRNHKLTMVMQDALGGSAKTLMFVNCSPAASNGDETLMSLKYATRAKKITNTAQKKN